VWGEEGAFGHWNGAAADDDRADRGGHGVRNSAVNESDYSGGCDVDDRIGGREVVYDRPCAKFGGEEVNGIAERAKGGVNGRFAECDYNGVDGAGTTAAARRNPYVPPDG
jgi:hypothetical protein